jgi:hypothetical protein
MRKSIKIAIIGSSVLILLAAAGIGWLSWKLRPQPAYSALPELARDLPRNVEEAQHTFRHRVKTRFPAGLPQASLIAELERQGFTVQDGRAYFNQSSFPCVRHWNLWWTLDSAAHIQEITSRYLLSCP